MLPTGALEAAQLVQTVLLVAALYALGTGIRLGVLVRTGGRSLVLGLTSWVLVAGLAYAGCACSASDPSERTASSQGAPGEAARRGSIAEWWQVRAAAPAAEGARPTSPRGGGSAPSRRTPTPSPSWARGGRCSG